MAASRCPNCDAPLTATEAAAGVCPDCAAALTVDARPAPVVAAPNPGSRASRSRWLFAAGLAAGVLLAAGAAGAWWAWGPVPVREREVASPAMAAGPDTAAEDLTRPVEIIERARLAVERADTDRTAAEHALAVAQDRLQKILDEVAAAEAEHASAESRLRAVQGKEAEPTVAKARAAIQQADAQRAGAERALADAQARLHAAKAKEDQARQAEVAARNARADAERALADARNKLQATRDQQGEADRQLVATRSRLQTARDQAATADRELADKKARLADRDRELQAKQAQLNDLGRTIQSKKATVEAGPAATGGSKAGGGFVRNWLVLGPFPAPDRKGHTLGFPPETAPFDLKKEYKAGAATLRWRPHASPADYVDYAALFRTEDPAVAYAICWVRSDRARKVTLSLGSNDGIKVWVGGKVVADIGVFRSASPGQDKLSCELAAGWNEVRVKIDNQGGPWGFYFEVRDPATDKPATGLEYSVIPPDSNAKK